MSFIQTVRRTTFVAILALVAMSAQACQITDPASTSPGLGSLGLWAWLMSFM